MEAMTLEQVRDRLRRQVDYTNEEITDGEAESMVAALTAHLAQPAQAVDVRSIREVIGEMEIKAPRVMLKHVDSWTERLTRALSGEKAGPVGDGEVLVAIERGEGYEDVHPDLVAEDCMAAAVERGWRYRVLTASPTPDKEGEE